MEPNAFRQGTSESNAIESMPNYDIDTKLTVHSGMKYTFSSSSMKGEALLGRLQNSFTDPCLIILMEDPLATMIDSSRNLIKSNDS
jgi:hypothetical protein